MGDLRFAILGHRAMSSGKLPLNDLAGGAGRMDVLVRAVNSALFVSHGIRADVDITLHLYGGSIPRRIWFEGRRLKGIHSDERSIAGHVAKVLTHPVPPVGRLIEHSTGLWHTGGTLEHTLQEWSKEGVDLFTLDAEGESFSTAIAQRTGRKLGFFLSDDRAFDENEFSMLARQTELVSVGKQWIQGHSAIAIVHHLLAGMQ